MALTKPAGLNDAPAGAPTNGIAARAERAAGRDEGAKGAEVVRDPICGMTFHPDEAATTRVADGVTYHFCAERCARTFDRERAPRSAAEAVAPWEPTATTPTATTPTAPGLPSWLVPVVCIGAVGVVLAVTVFGVSTSTLLTGAVVLACPLMHVFMMRGHGGHSGHGSADTPPSHTAAAAGDRSSGQPGARPGGRGCH
ncbi:MAG TPA: DUF2933 domain-containing protein [Chloroflexota bacterium]|nr:DUF2933 domain-containing protein [Chloroflexota bacterium]